VVALAVGALLFVLLRRRKRQGGAYEISSTASINMGMRDDNQMSIHPIHYYTVVQGSADQHDHAQSGSLQETMPINSSEYSSDTGSSSAAATYTPPGAEVNELVSVVP
jgi:hypothetical protein